MKRGLPPGAKLLADVDHVLYLAHFERRLL